MTEEQAKRLLDFFQRISEAETIDHALSMCRDMNHCGPPKETLTITINTPSGSVSVEDIKCLLEGIPAIDDVLWSVS
jgi:hypothetical protein